MTAFKEEVQIRGIVTSHAKYIQGFFFNYQHRVLNNKLIYIKKVQNEKPTIRISIKRVVFTKNLQCLKQ